MRAWLNLRYTEDKRARLFIEGLKRHGYTIEHGRPRDVRPSDILVVWNRVGIYDRVAKEFEQRGQTVLVVENATWGNSFAGREWYHIARNYHNTASQFDVFNPERWGNLNVELKPWKTGDDSLILLQRGIGSDPVRMPKWWPPHAKKKYGGRVRKHPGKRPPKNSLEQDLQNVGRVITWGSGAAIKCLIEGYPVISDYQNWIGTQNNTDTGRREMFERLAWAQWTHDEIKSGFAFGCLLNP